jgi:hypothetical protein
VKLTQFLQYANQELSSIAHPYADDATVALENIELRVRVVDYVVRRGTGVNVALAEKFYDALSQYLNAPRYNRASIRGAVDRLAVLFETFLRTAIASIVPDRDIEMRERGICLTEVPTRCSGVASSGATPTRRTAAGSLVELSRGSVRDLGGLLEKSVEQEATSPGGASVEPEGELVQVVGKLGLRDAALIRPEKPALDERRHAVRSWQQHMR